jgi:hypothetical protein
VLGGWCAPVGSLVVTHLLLVVQVERKHRIHRGPRSSVVLAVASAVQCWLPVLAMGRRASNPIIVSHHNCSLRLVGFLVFAIIVSTHNCSLRLVGFLVFAIIVAHNTLLLGTITHSAHSSCGLNSVGVSVWLCVRVGNVARARRFDWPLVLLKHPWVRRGRPSSPSCVCTFKTM